MAASGFRPPIDSYRKEFAVAFGIAALLLAGGFIESTASMAIRSCAAFAATTFRTPKSSHATVMPRN
jgi:hypothetical protein